MRNLDKQTIIIGDMNLPDIIWSEMISAARGRRVLMTAQTENLEQLVDFPTHTKGNILDIILTNCADRVISISDGGRIGKTDHCILNIEVRVKFVKSTDKVTRSNWTKADMEGLRKLLSKINWPSIFEGKVVDEAWKSFRATLDTAIAKFVPRSTVRDNNTPKWLTREIIRLVRRKKCAWRLTQTHSTTENIKKYKELEKEVTVKLKNAKRNMEKRLANSGENNAKTFANYIKSKTKSHTGIGPLKRPDATLVSLRIEKFLKSSTNFLQVCSQTKTQQTSQYAIWKQTRNLKMSSLHEE